MSERESCPFCGGTGGVMLREWIPYDYRKRWDGSPASSGAADIWSRVEPAAVCVDCGAPVMSATGYVSLGRRDGTACY